MGLRSEPLEVVGGPERLSFLVVPYRLSRTDVLRLYTPFPRL